MSELKSKLEPKALSLRERWLNFIDPNRRAREVAATAEAFALLRRFGDVAAAREWCANRLRGAPYHRQRYLKLVWKHLDDPADD